MKIATCVCLLALVAAVYGNACMNMDASKCSVSCSNGEVKACEHGICTCAPACTQMTDCADCPSITGPDGHQVHQEKHCIDGACVCNPAPHGGQQPGGGGHHPPGGR